MTIYWTIATIPELASLTPAERRRAWRAVFWKAFRHWQVWLSLVPMCVLIGVGTSLGRSAGLSWLGAAIGAGVGSLVFSAVHQRFARPYLADAVQRLRAGAGGANGRPLGG
jgi:H+/Cl- antiporter ClcA